MQDLWRLVKVHRTTRVRLDYNLLNCMNVGLFGFASFGKKLVWNEISSSECLLQWPLVSRLWMPLLQALTLSPFVKLELDLQMEPWNHLNWSYKRADWCMEQRENRRKERARREKKITEQIWLKNKYEQKDNLNIDIYQMDENLFMMKLTTKVHQACMCIKWDHINGPHMLNKCT